MSQEEVNVKSKLNRRQRYLQLVAAGIMAVLVVAVAWLAYAYTELNQSNARLQEEVTNLKTKATPSPDKPTVPTLNQPQLLSQRTITISQMLPH